MKNRKRSTIPHFKIRACVLDQIRNSVGKLTAEAGGMLGGERTVTGGIITHYVFDERASTSGATYSPDVDFLRPLLKDHWNPANIMMTGFVHSHPEGCRQLSHGDEIYAARIFDHNPEINFFFLPLVFPAGPRRDECEILYFAVVRLDNGIAIVKPTIEIIEDARSECGAIGHPEAMPHPVFEHFGNGEALGDTFLRAESSYDLARLQRCRIVAFGTGSAVGFIEDMVRAGIGEVGIIDPDIVSMTNLATQQVYRSDMGMPKVVALGHRLIDINPNLRCFGWQAKGETLRAHMQYILRQPWQSGDHAPLTTLICGLTDSFDAQRLVNELALQHRLPSLCAQLYQRGDAVETTFTDPDLSRACHRCILSGRYAQYANGYRNEVGSAGAPIFASTRLNALKGYIALALLHRDIQTPVTGHIMGSSGSVTLPITDTVCNAGQPWRKIWQHICQRNLALTRLSPDVAVSLGIRHFDKALAGARGADQLYFDETLWRHQLPEHPATGYAQACPDCGGTGRMTWHDTGTFLSA